MLVWIQSNPKGLQMQKLMYRVREAVDVTGLSRTRLYELIAAGEIESVKVGRARLITARALSAYVDSIDRASAPEEEPAKP